MEADTQSSPVDPQPKRASPIVEINCDIQQEDSPNGVIQQENTPNTAEDSIADLDVSINSYDNEELEEILRRNKQFLDEHCFRPVEDSPVLQGLNKKIGVIDTNKHSEDETVNICSEEVCAEIFVTECRPQLNSVSERDEDKISNSHIGEDKTDLNDTGKSSSQKDTDIDIKDREDNKIESCEEDKTDLQDTEKTSSQKDKDIVNIDEEDLKIESCQSENMTEVEVKVSSPPPSFAPSAVCKYRWSKVVDTSSTDIGFYPSYSQNEPVLLSWDNALRAYYSVDQEIVCGDYHGNLVVDGNVHPVEQFNVRTYTFEVDLFIKEDLSDEEIQPIQPTHPVHKVSETPQVDSKMDLLSKDIIAADSNTHLVAADEHDQVRLAEEKSTEDFISSVTSSLKFENLSSSKRHSPVGDDAVKSFNEFSPIRNDFGDSLNKSSSSDDKIRPSSRGSNRSGKQFDVIDDVVGDSPRQFFSTNISNSAHSLVSGNVDGQPTIPSAMHDPSALDAIYRRPSSKVSDRNSPSTSGRQGSDVDYPSKEVQRSSVSPAYSLSRSTPTREVTPTHSSGTSFGRERIVENGDGPQSGSRPPSHPASRHSSHSNQSSRPQSISSISSEQELGQYMGHGSRSSSVDRTGTPGANIPCEDFIIQATRQKETDRPPSISSHSQQYNSEIRSKTPDNRVRVPQSQDFTPLRGNLTSSHQELEFRTTDRSNSRASSRTITPIMSEREDYSPKVKDLEDNVANLRKLLTKREAEVHSLNSQISDLRDINRSLQDDLEHVKRHRSGAREDEVLEFKQILSEKEILATEVVSLRDEVKRLRAGGGRKSADITHYSPTSPPVLQRKIDDLESHLRDLQEAHETATGKLSKAEKTIKSLQDENKELKSCSLSMADLQDVGGHHLRVEMITLREDLRNLKERNFHLTEENMRLTEAAKSKDMSITGHGESKMNGNYKLDDGVIRSQSNSYYQTEKMYRTSYSNGSESRPTLSTSSSQKLKLEDLAPKELRHDYSYTSEHSRPLLQRESLEGSRLRYMHKSDSSPNVRSIGVTRSTEVSADRSRPDGEISEKLHSQLLLDSSSYERKYLSGDKPPRLHSDIHSFRPRNYNKDDRNGDRDRIATDRGSGELSDREYSSRSSCAALNSKEIFFNLKQKRANQWLQQDKYVSGNLEGQRHASHHHVNNVDLRTSMYTDELADDSDTATDILLAQESGSRAGQLPIKGHPGSDDSVSSLSDGESGDATRLRSRRSKSVEFRRGQDNSSRQLIRSGSATRPLNSLESSRNSSGLRSVLPSPLVTQHNKVNLSTSSPSLLNSSLTQGMRPFAPCTPSDVRNGDVIKFSRQGGKLTQGVVKYVGHLPGRSDAYCGVELDKDEGKHDGTFETIRYFKCKPNKGVFVAFNKIVMAWAP